MTRHSGSYPRVTQLTGILSLVNIIQLLIHRYAVSYVTTIMVSSPQTWLVSYFHYSVTSDQLVFPTIPADVECNSLNGTSMIPIVPQKVVYRSHRYCPFLGKRNKDIKKKPMKVSLCWVDVQLRKENVMIMIIFPGPLDWFE